MTPNAGVADRARFTHNLKTWPPYLEAMIEGRKTFEVRKNDRDYREGDTLHLLGWNPSTGDYTGREHTLLVTYVLPGGSFGVAADHVVMGVKPKTIDHLGVTPSSSPAHPRCEACAALDHDGCSGDCQCDCPIANGY